MITDDYKKDLKTLHTQQDQFGAGSVTKKHYPTIEKLITNNSCESLLDYGCGKGDLIQHIVSAKTLPEGAVAGYDVGNPEFDHRPETSADIVTCMDVMEHVEFYHLSAVLFDIKSLTNKLAVFSIAGYPARKVLPDGRNAHIIQQPSSFWFSTLSNFFRVDSFLRTAKAEGLYICSALKEKDAPR